MSRDLTILSFLGVCRRSLGPLILGCECLKMMADMAMVLALEVWVNASHAAQSGAMKVALRQAVVKVRVVPHSPRCAGRVCWLFPLSRRQLRCLGCAASGCPPSYMLPSLQVERCALTPIYKDKKKRRSVH